MQTLTFKKVAAFLLEFFRASPYHLVVIVLAMLLMGLSQGLILFLLKPFLTLLLTSFNAESINLAVLIDKKFINWISIPGDLLIAKEQAIFLLPLMLVGAGAIRFGSLFYYQYFQQLILIKFAKGLRQKIFCQILARPFLEFKGHPLGEWTSLIINNVENLQQKMSDFVINVFKDLIMVVSAIFFLGLIHKPSAYVIVIFSPFISYFMGRTGKKISHYAKQNQITLTTLAGGVLSLRQRFLFCRLQGGEKMELAKFNQVNSHYREVMLKTILLRSMYAPMVELLGLVILVGVFYSMTKGWLGSDYNSIVLVQLIAAFGLIIKNLSSLGEQFGKLHEFLGALSHSFNYFPDGALSPSPKLDRSPIVNQEAVKLPVDIKIAALEFTYKAGQKILVTDFGIKVGEKIAVIGPSGSGKSTVIRILAGLIDPQAWQASIKLEDLTARTCFVSQEPFLFNDTLRENLSYGLKDPPSDLLLNEILQKINLPQLADKLPEGLSTRFEYLLQNFSGGELQRLTLGRMFLRQEKSILLLDEVTSFLDQKTEEQVVRNIFSHADANHMSVVMVTHRLNYLEKFDRVVFMEEGNIKYSGSISQLQKWPRFIQYAHEGR